MKTRKGKLATGLIAPFVNVLVITSFPRPFYSWPAGTPSGINSGSPSVPPSLPPSLPRGRSLEETSARIGSPALRRVAVTSQRNASHRSASQASGSCIVKMFLLCSSLFSVHFRSPPTARRGEAKRREEGCHQRKACYTYVYLKANQSDCMPSCIRVRQSEQN